MRVSNVSGMLLCILDGSERVVCLSDVLSFLVALSLSLCFCCHFPGDDLSRSDSRREESHERIEAVSLRENMSCLTHDANCYMCVLVDWTSLD